LVTCPACDFRAGVAADGPGRARWFECEVCGFAGTALRSTSGALEHRDRAEILDELNPTPMMSPKEMSVYEPDRSCCGECFDADATVAPDGDDYVCVGCGARFEPGSASQCEWCSQRWFGWEAEGSYYTGCEHCDGHEVDD
jgi:hypothetical protein